MAWGHLKGTKYDKPASGIPSRPASMGDGWGGSAKGAGGALFSKDVQPDWSPEAVEERRKAAPEREARIAQLTDHLSDLALNAEREETQVSATVAALNRLEGMPKQKIEADTRNLTLEDMVKEAAKMRGQKPV